MVFLRFSYGFPIDPIVSMGMTNQQAQLVPTSPRLTTSPGPRLKVVAPWQRGVNVEAGGPQMIFTYITGWWFGTFFMFPYIGTNHPN